VATYGWQAIGWSSSWEFWGWNTENNVSTGNFLAPDNGTVTAVVFNCANYLNGQAGPMVANGCIWDGSGNLLVAGSQVTLPTDTQHAGPYAWNTSTMAWAMAVGQVMRLGWWRNPALAAGDNIFGYATPGQTLLGTTANSVAAGAFGQDSSQTLQIGVYMVYTPAVPPPAPAPPRQIQNRQVVWELMREDILQK
jgi:hypothetical protein